MSSNPQKNQKFGKNPPKPTTTDDIPPQTTTITDTGNKKVSFAAPSITTPHSDASDDEHSSQKSFQNKSNLKSKRRTTRNNTPISPSPHYTPQSTSENESDPSDGSFMTSDSDYDESFLLSPSLTGNTSATELRQKVLMDAQQLTIPPLTHEELSELPNEFYSKYYNCVTPADKKYSDYLEEYVNHCYYCTNPGCLPYHIDILRNLSIRGYINSHHRRRIWPLLLGVMREDIDLYYTRYINPDHLMYDQLNKDVLRSCNHLDVHLESTQDIIDNNRQYCGKILHSLFAKYDSNLISYCQGFHDIAVVCLTICGVSPPEDIILDKISKLGNELILENKSYTNDYASSLSGSLTTRSNSTFSNTGENSTGSRNGSSLLGLTNPSLNNLSLNNTNTTNSSLLSSSTINDSINSSATDMTYLSRTRKGSKRGQKDEKYYSKNDRHRRHLSIQSAVQKATTETIVNIKKNSNDALAYALVEKLALTSMNQTLQTSLQSVQNLISIVPTILQPFVPEFATILSQIPLIYSLSWFLTWFSHSTVNVNLISRMFDFLLASNPLVCVQVSSAVLITHAPRIKLQLQMAKKERIIMEYGCTQDEVETITEQEALAQGDQDIINELDMVAIIQYFQQCDLVLDIDAIIHIATSLWALSSQRLIHIENSIVKPIANQNNYLHFSQHTGDYYFSNQYKQYKQSHDQEKEALFNYFNLSTHYALQKQSYPLDLSLFGLIKLPLVLARWLKRPRVVNILSLRMTLQHLLLANGLSHKQFQLPSWKPQSTYGLLDIDHELQQMDPNLNLNDNNNNSTPQSVPLSSSNNNNTLISSPPKSSLQMTVGTNLVSDIVSLCGDLNEIHSLTASTSNTSSKSTPSSTHLIPINHTTVTKSALEKCNVQQILTPNSTLLITHSFLYYSFRPNSLALDPVSPPNLLNGTITSTIHHSQAGGKLNNAISLWKTPDGSPLKQLGACAIQLPTLSVQCFIGHTTVNKFVNNYEGNEDDNDGNNNSNSTFQPTTQSTLQTNPLEIAAFVNLQYIMEPPQIIKPSHSKQQLDIIYDIFGGRGILKRQAQHHHLKSLISPLPHGTNDNGIKKASICDSNGNIIKNIDFDDIDENVELPHQIDPSDNDEEANYQKAAAETKKLRGLDKFRRPQDNEKDAVAQNKKGVTFPQQSHDLQQSLDLPDSDEEEYIRLERLKRKQKEKDEHIAARKKLIEYKLSKNKELFETKLRQELLSQADYDRNMEYQLNDEDGNVIINNEADRISLLLNPAAAAASTASAAADADAIAPSTTHMGHVKPSPNLLDPSTAPQSTHQQSSIQSSKLFSAQNPVQNASKHVQIVVIDGNTRVIYMNDEGVETTSYFALQNQIDNSPGRPNDLEHGQVIIPTHSKHPLEEIVSNNIEDVEEDDENKHNQDDELNPYGRSILEQDITDIGFDTTVDVLVDKSIEYEIDNDPTIKKWWADQQLKKELFGPLSDQEIIALQEFQYNSRYIDDYNESIAKKHNENLLSADPTLTSTLHDLVADSITFDHLRGNNQSNVRIPVKNQRGDIIQINPNKIPYSKGLKQYIIDPEQFQQLLDSTPPSINNMPVSMFLKIRAKKQALEQKYHIQLQQEQQQYSIWRITQQQQEQEQILKEQLRYEQQQLMLLDIKGKELSIEIDRLNDLDIDTEQNNHNEGQLVKRRARVQKKLHQDKKEQHHVLQQQHFQRVLFLQEEQQRLELYHQSEINRILQLTISNVNDTDFTTIPRNDNIVIPIAPMAVKPSLIQNNSALATFDGLTSDTIMIRSALTSLPPETNKQLTSSKEIKDAKDLKNAVPLPPTVQNQVLLTNEIHNKLVQPEYLSDADSDDIVNSMKTAMNNVMPMTPQQITTIQPYMKHYDTTTVAIADRLGLPAPNNTNRLTILKAKIQQKKQKEDALRSKSFLFNSLDYFNTNTTSNPYSESSMSLLSKTILDKSNNDKTKDEIDEVEFDRIHKPKGWLSTIGSIVGSTINTLLNSPLDIFTSDSDDDDDEYGYSYGQHHNATSPGLITTSGVTNDEDYMYNDPNIRRRIRNERKAILFEKEQMNILRQNIPYLPLSQQQQQYKAIILNAALLRMGYPIIQPQTEEQQESFYWGQLMHNTDPFIIKRLNQITHKTQRLQYAADKLTEYLLIVLDNVNIHQIKPEVRLVNEESKRVYNIHSLADAQRQYMYDTDVSKLIVLQLIGQLGWILKQEDTQWLDEYQHVLSAHHQDALAVYEQKSLVANAAGLNGMQDSGQHDDPSPLSQKSLGVPTLIPTLTSTQQPLIPLFPEVRKYIISQLHKKDQQSLQNGTISHPLNTIVDYNMMTDNELRSLIAQHHYQIKIIDAYTGTGPEGRVNPVSIPRLPRYSVEWVEYQRQVQERILLQRKEWLIRGYSERKIRRLSKIEKRRLIFGNLVGNGDEDNIGEYGEDLNSQHHQNNDRMSLTVKKENKLNRKLAKSALTGTNPADTDSSDSDQDDDQQVAVYNKKDMMSTKNSRQLFETSQRKLLQLSIAPKTVMKSISTRGVATGTRQGDVDLTNLGLEKDVKIIDAYYHTIDLPLFSFRLTKEQRRQELLVRRAQLVSSSSPSTSDTSDDNDPDDYGLPPSANTSTRSPSIRRLDSTLNHNEFDHYLQKKQKKAMRRTIVDDVSRIIQHQKKESYKKRQEERRIRLLRQQYRAELRFKRRQAKAEEKIKRLKQGISIYDMLTSSTSTDYYSSSSSAGNMFGSSDFSSDSNLFTTESSSTDDEEEEEQVSIVNQVLNLQKLNKNDSAKALKVSKHIRKQKSRNKILSLDQDDEDDIVDPLKHHHQQKVLSQLEQKQLMLLEKKYTRQSRQRQFILSTPLTPVSLDVLENRTSSIQMIKDQSSSNANSILRTVLKICSYPFAILTQPVDQHLETINNMSATNSHAKLSQLPSLTNIQKQLEAPTNLANNSGNTSLSNNDNVEYSYSILTDIAPASNIISNASKYTSDTYRRFPSHSTNQDQDAQAGTDEAIKQKQSSSTLKKPLPIIGKRKTDPSIAILSTRDQEQNGETAATQPHTIFIPTVYDYYTHIKRISHVHSCSCKYQYDMINTRKSILYYSKLMTIQLLLGSISAWGISSLFGLFEYFFPRTHGTQHWWKSLTITMLSDLYTLSCNTSKYASVSLSFSPNSLAQFTDETAPIVEYDPKTIIYNKFHNKSPRLSIRYPLPPSILWVPSVNHLCMMNEYNVFSLWLSKAHGDAIISQQKEGTENNSIITSDGVLVYPDHCCDCILADDETCIHQQQRLLQKQQLSNQYHYNAQQYVSLYPPSPLFSDESSSPTCSSDNPMAQTKAPPLQQGLPTSPSGSNTALCVCETVTFQHYFLTPSEQITCKSVSSTLQSSVKHPPNTNPTNHAENAHLANVPNTSTLDTLSTALGPSNLPSSPAHIITHAIGTIIPSSPTALFWYSVGFVVVISGVVEFLRR